jgi:hypothetical protein
MPWTTDDDVDKHKSGLSKKGKAQWRRIANSVLKKLMAKGMSEEEAAVSAIKQANGVVMNTNESKGKYSVYSNKQVLDYEVKLIVHQEKAHLVIPVVMMVEGVHNGNQGPIFHSIAELGKFPESWNGIPVVIYHPEEDGLAVSANSPDVIDKMTVGRVYNTSVEGKKLKAEVWLDEDKLNNVSSKTLDEINDTKEVEVSLGMFTENEDAEGEYEGEVYTKIAHNHRPDHLAILPDQVGACSCADGCGLGANKKKDEDIIEKPCKGTDAGEPDEEDDDDLNLSKCKTKKEVTKMERSKCTPCVEKKVKELIANSQGRFIEDDKVWLETLEESQLDKLFVKEELKPVVETNKVEEKKEPEVITPVTNELSPEDKAALAYGRKQLKERKEKMIQGIQANTEKGTWDDATLNAMSEDMLEKVFKSVKREEVPADYSLNASAPVNTNTSGSGGSLYPVGVVIENKK